MGVDRGTDEGGERRRLALQPDLAGPDARDVEQVVDQADHLSHLALHHRSNALDRRRLIGAEPDDLEPGADRRERIAASPRAGPASSMRGATYGSPVSRVWRIRATASVASGSG
jgi:hypothetical protein